MRRNLLFLAATLFVTIWGINQIPALILASTSGEVNILTVAQRLTPCLDPIAPPTPARAKNLLRVVYNDQGKLWLWQEETKTATPFPLPADAVEARLSADGQLIAFWRVLDERERELWVVNQDGSHARKLVTASAEETLDRYPDAIGANAYFSWVEDTHTLAYHFHPTFDGLGDVPLEEVHLVDADTGKIRVVTPPGEVNALTYAPEGSQIAALTATELRLINTADGRVEFILPLPLTILPDQSQAYSPDGQYLVVFTTEGVAIVNSTDGSYHELLLAYQPIGLGHTSFTPPILWLDDALAFYTLINTSDDVFDPTATFTVWRVDLTTATATPVNTFTGNILSAELSPDRQRLAFWIQDQQNNRQLYLADVVSGRQILYEEGSLIEFLGWNPDSTQFVYRFFDQPELYLGHLCQSPKALDTILPASQVQWVDIDCYLTLEGQPGQWELRLYALNNTSTLVATLHDESPSYYFYFEKPPAPQQAGTVEINTTASTIKVGDRVTVTGVPVGIGLPYYTLYLNAVPVVTITYDNEVKAQNFTDQPFELISTSASGSQIEFVLRALQPETIQASIGASGEVQLDTQGPSAWAWGSATSTEVTLTIVK